MSEVWTKKCSCGFFIPDDQTICDDCLKRKYDFYNHVIYNDCSDKYPEAVDLNYVITLIREITSE